MKEISDELYAKLEYLGIIQNEVRSHNVGKSNYSKKTIQPWAVWLDYPELTGWDDDIIKRVLRIKEEEGMSVNEARKMDYEKIIHNCQERIRQLNLKETIKHNTPCESASNETKKYLCKKDFYIDMGGSLKQLFTCGSVYKSTKNNLLMDDYGVPTILTKAQIDECFELLKEK